MNSEEKSFTEYIDYLEKYYAFEEIDVNQMNIVGDTLAQDNRSISGQAKQIVMPEYEACRTFHTAVMNFLENDARIIQTYADINKHIESNNPGTDTDINEVFVMLEPLLEQNDTAFNQIIVAQKEMSDKFRFKLE